MTDTGGPAHAPEGTGPARRGTPAGNAAPGRRARWPAYSLAAVLLGYAAGKAVYAAQGRLGFPSGPAVSAGEHERYAEQMMDPALTQWLAVATGVLCAALVVATATSAGRRVPRVLMFPALAVVLVGVGAGAVTLVVDGFVGVGVGWRWYHGVVGAAVLGLMAATVRSYAGGSGRGGT